VKVTIRPNVSDDPRIVGYLRLLTLLGYCNATMKWYVGDRGGRTELPPHESIIALSLLLGATGEAAHLFRELANKGVITLQSSWPARAKEAWAFLHSSVVSQLRNDYLKAIRDKVAFHADQRPIVDFLCDAEEDNQEVTIWESSSEDRGGHPPISALVIGSWLVKLSVPKPEAAQLCSKVYRALRDVSLAGINTATKVKITE
jgi:hypothetical protein